MKTEKMKAYKVFNPDWTCREFKYKVGDEYSISEEPIMCERGFHACKKVSDCFSYYSFDPKNKVALVELSGTILGDDEEKQCAQKIKIIKEISWNEMLLLANTGHGNSGNSNSGNRNSGNRNSGNSNSGDRNSGNSNSGNINSGDSNSGHFNTTTPEFINCFNEPCKRIEWNDAAKPNFIYNANLNQWVWWSDMSEEEKANNKNAFVCDGYLKTVSYKEAWNSAYKNVSEKDIVLLKNLPNWDANIFEEITGIKIK